MLNDKKKIGPLGTSLLVLIAICGASAATQLLDGNNTAANTAVNKFQKRFPEFSQKPPKKETLEYINIGKYSSGAIEYLKSEGDFENAQKMEKANVAADKETTFIADANSHQR